MTDLIAKGRSDFDALTLAISQTSDISDLHEVRARIEAVKAWAKVHKKAKEMRLDLLRVEMDALVRIVQLGGADTLSASDRQAAEWLAAMSEADRAAILASSATATTVAGMCRSIWREDEVRRQRDRMHTAGIRFAESPEPPPAWDEDAIRRARRGYSNIAAGLADILDSYTTEGEPFTISEMAEDILRDTTYTYNEIDPAFQEGVKEVCRTAVRKAPPLTIDGTLIPQFITARLSDGEYIRVPTENALLEHVEDMVRMRAEQLAQDAAALKRLEQFRDRLRDVPGAEVDARVGDLIAKTIVSPPRASDAAA